jgi:hypothetical protein
MRRSNGIRATACALATVASSWDHLIQINEF